MTGPIAVPISRIFAAAVLVLGLLAPTAVSAHDPDPGSCNADGGHAHVNIGNGVADEDDGTVTFTVTCNPCGKVNANTWWRTFDGTATAPDDYTAVNGQLITIGTTSADLQTYNIVVTLNDDTMFEGNETFTVGLGGQPGGEANPSVGPPCLFLGNTTGTGTIVENDPMNSPPDCSGAAIADQSADGSCQASISGADVTGVTDPDGDTPTIMVSPATLALGANTVTVSADDGNGGTCEKEITVNVIDDTDPVITCPANVALNADATCDATYAGPPATATDNCPGVSVAANPVLPAQFNGVGDNIIMYTATDGSGNTDACDQTVSVVDVTPPDVTLNGDNPVTLECSIDTYVEEGATVADNCDPTPSLVIDNSAVDETMVGTYQVTYDASDASGNTAMETRDVIVEDTTPPEITVEADPIVLWPPNHKYATIDLTSVVVDATDICDQDVSADDVAITSVSSDEEENVGGGGDGNTVDDIVIAGDCRSVDLRKERQGGGNGRVYTLDLAVEDSSGNVGTASFEVHVPHNKKGTAVNDGPIYSVAGACPGADTVTRSSLFKGKILDALDAEGLAGVIVRSAGGATAITNEHGRYAIEMPGDGIAQMRLKKPGYFNRRTYVESLKQVNRADLSLIPQGRAFSMAFFERVFREPLAESPMTRRWVEEPSFEIYSRQFAPIGGGELQAGARVPKQFRRLLEEVLRTDVPLYSGGVLRGDQIRWIDHKRGERIDQPLHEEGRVLVMIREDACASGSEATTLLKWSAAGILEGGRIDLFGDCGGMDRAVFSHQLAHHLGFFHAGNRDEVPLPSVMAGADGPTEADVLHGAVLYQRFPGNRGPDRDLHPERMSAKGSASGRSVSLSCKR